MEKQHWEHFFGVITSSFSVANHHDLNKWLETELTKFLSHEMMICCWGDFNSVVLDYDITAYQLNQENIRVLNPETFSIMMRRLHDRWLKNNSRWFMLHDTDEFFPHITLETNLKLILNEHKTILVYGNNDMGGKNTCLYVFLSKNPGIVIDHYVIGMVMPYLDAAIRRISGIVSLKSEDHFMLLSKREREILHWVNSGKTNYEIGEILNISYNTVKNHLKIIFKKLNVVSRTQAATKLPVLTKH